jgi:hypothetical protein
MTLVLFSLAKAMLEPRHHACLLSLLLFLTVFYNKNGIVWPKACQEMSLFASSIMLLVLSLDCWHDVMMGPSFNLCQATLTLNVSS